jgi:hypothetical protein
MTMLVQSCNDTRQVNSRHRQEQLFGLRFFDPRVLSAPLRPLHGQTVQVLAFIRNILDAIRIDGENLGEREE